MALESPTHLSIGRNLGGVSKLFDTDSGPTYPVKFRQTFSDGPKRGVSPAPPSPYKSDVSKETCQMSSTFEEVLKSYTNDTSDGVKPETRVDRIMDAFRRGESMLLSADNMRPKSRCKTTLLESDNVSRKIMHSSSLERPSSFKNSLKPRTLSQYSPDNVFGSNTKTDTNGNILNVTNNAESAENVMPKKGKKYRKRAKSEGKNKRNKQGKPPIQPPAKYSSTPSVFSHTNGHVSRRISSEPLSKNSSTASHTMQGTGLDNGNKLEALSINNSRSTKDGAPAQPHSIKYKHSHSNSSPVTTHHIHGHNRPNSSPVVDNDLQNGMLIAHGLHVTVHKPDFRVRSGHSSRSEEVRNKSPNSTKEEIFKDNRTLQSEQLLVLNAKPINVHRPQHVVSPSGSQRKHLHPVLSAGADTASRQASLEAIYGAMHNTANRITAQVEELKKVKKIFLSERQSGTIKESGMEYPCAPPATPTPDVMKRYEYVPSMADIRSQRAVKGRLHAMEKDAQKKKEKQKETNARLEKQQIKDREKTIKANQRKEIYALNKIMTELEHKRFLEFCHSKGLNKT